MVSDLGSIILRFDVCRFPSGPLYEPGCTTQILWYITVLSLVRSNSGKYLLLAIAVFFIVAGDYASFLQHVKRII